MLADTHKSMASGKIEGPEIDAPIITVVSCVEQVLITFSEQYADSNIRNEKGLTQKLIHLLTVHASKKYYPFYFQKEYMEDPERNDSPQVDIGVISTSKEGIIIGVKPYEGESFFSMEAKRLGRLGSNRSKEYLIGRTEKNKYNSCGGVERFKQGIHGRGLPYGAIIGFVQEYDFDYWHGLLNSWVEDLIHKSIYSPVTWHIRDKLQKEHIKSTTAKFISITSRKNDFITLFHLWARLN
jgi:hypothetical protein